jgi:hypothetical protein
MLKCEKIMFFNLQNAERCVRFGKDIVSHSYNIIYIDFFFVNMKTTKVCISWNDCVYSVEETTLSVSFHLHC